MKTITITDDQSSASYQRRITFETTRSGNVEVKVNEALILTIPHSDRDKVADVIAETSPSFVAP